MITEGITRRTFIKGATAILASASLGFTGLSLVSCSEGSTTPEPDTEGGVSVTVADGSFSVDGGNAVPFRGNRISLVPHAADGTICIAFTDADDTPEQLKIGSLGDPVTIHGNLGMLTADGIAGEGEVHIANDATVSVFSVGSIEKTSVAGSVDCLVVVGESDVETMGASHIENLVAGKNPGIVTAADDAAPLNVYSPADELKALTDKPITIHDEYAVEMNARCLQIFDDGDAANDGDWLGMLDDGQPIGMDRTKAPNTGEADGDSNLESNADAKDSPSTAGGYDSDDVELIGEDDIDTAILDDGGDDAWTSADPPDDETPDVPDSEVDDLLVGDTASDEVPYPQLDDINLTSIETDLLKDALKGILKYAGEQIGDYASDKLLDAVFGGDDHSAEIIAKLDEIEGELQDIENQISNLSKQLTKYAFATQVDNFISQYSVDIRTWLGAQDSNRDEIDALQDKNDRATQRKKFAENLIDGPNFALLGKSVAYTAQTVGNAILQSYTSSGTNLFGAFDGLAQYTYKWEHQGYNDRMTFQNYLLAEYVAITAYAQYALRERIDVTKGDPNRKDEYLTAIAWAKTLFGKLPAFDDALADPDYAAAAQAAGIDPDDDEPAIVQQVLDMAEKQKVVQRPSSERYYQVPGHEIHFTASSARVKTDKKARNNQKQLIWDDAGHHAVPRDKLADMLKDYGEGHYLDGILFGEDEGAIAAPPNTGYRIVCYEWPLEKKWEAPCYIVYVPVIETNGKQWEQKVWVYRQRASAHKEWVVDASFNCVYCFDE